MPFFAITAGVIHIYIFVMESLMWGSKRTNRAFGVSAELAEHNRLFAFNQGFYNLFLALAVFIGLGLMVSGGVEFGIALVAYACVSMLGAAIVLLYSQPKLLTAAMIQGLPPLIALVFIFWK